MDGPFISLSECPFFPVLAVERKIASYKSNVHFHNTHRLTVTKNRRTAGSLYGLQTSSTEPFNRSLGLEVWSVGNGLFTYESLV